MVDMSGNPADPGRENPMYKICFQCEDMQMASALIQAAANNNPPIRLISMTEDVVEIKKKSSRKGQIRPRKGEPTGKDLVLTTVKQSPGINLQGLEKVFTSNQRSTSSANTEINKALRAKTIKIKDDGYHLAK